MTALDILVLLLVGGLAFGGFRRGFTFEVLTLAGWVAGVLALKAFHAQLSAALLPHVGAPSGAGALAFAILFFVPLILVKLAADRIGARTRKSVVGPFDRVLGAGFGAVKGLIAASLIYLAVTLVTDTVGGVDQRPDWIRNAQTGPLLSATSRAISGWVEERRRGGASSP